MLNPGETPLREVVSLFYRILLLVIVFQKFVHQLVNLDA